MYIKRHVRRRLAHAKESCDKELTSIIDSITAYVEERLQEEDDLDYASAIAPSETDNEDGGNETDLDIPLTSTSRHSRHRKLLLLFYLREMIVNDVCTRDSFNCQFES